MKPNKSLDTESGSFGPRPLFKKFFFALSLTFWLFPPRTIVAGDTVLGDSCNLGILSATDKQTFLRFDKELRTALSRQNVEATALLVDLPLRINYPDGSTILIGNVKALQTRFSEIFPPHVRSAILNQKIDEIFCNDEGIMYGSGALWVQRIESQPVELYRAFAINLRSPAVRRRPYESTGLQFVCDAADRRIVIDTDASKRVRYRAWNQPRAVTDKPDIELISGTVLFDGSGLCVYPIWTFTKGTSKFMVRRVGCTDGSEPKGTTGEFEISLGDTVQQRSWCR
jgi:hypothetical protein